MACAVISGFSVDCRESIGGIKKIWFTNFNNVTALTLTAEVITGITMTGATKFWGYEQVKETSNYVEAIQVSPENGTLGYETTLTAVFNKSDSTLRNQIRLLAQGALMVCILDRNGKYWMMGQYAGVEMANSTHNSGTAMGDRNGYELSFIAKESLPMYEVTQAAIQAVDDIA